MASYQRIALYVVFDSLERDLVEYIRRSIQVSCEVLLTDDEAKRARERIARRGRDDLYNLDNHYDLLNGLDLADKFDLILRHKDKLSTSEAKYFLSLKKEFDKAAPIRADVMHGRPLTLDDYVSGFAFGNHLNQRSDIWRNLAQSLKDLRENPESVSSKAITIFDEERPPAVLHNLPKVDYDDTGFVPRPQLEAELKKKILGRHPVITVLGEGGNGKSALMLQTAYQLVYSQDHNFDAIIWVSAKLTVLTIKEITRIKKAITSIDLFESIAEFEPGQEDPISRVKRLLSDNRILLIIDNLETVLDDQIRKFAEDIPGESKLVFTSRVPLEAGVSVKVGEFTELEAERFLRGLITAYDIKTLNQVPPVVFKGYLAKLHSKPLLIKWFARGVLSGLAPESITRNPNIAIQFCLENVINTLNQPTIKVAMAFAHVPDSHSALIIQYLTGLSPLDVESAIAALRRYGIIEDCSDNCVERRYSMRVFVKEYLSKIEWQPEIVKSFQKNYARIREMFQEQRAVTSVNRYNMNHYTVRSPSEAIAARKLVQAFKKSERRELDEGLKIIDDLRVSAPEYFEVYRVAAAIYAKAGNISEAQRNYEVAIDIDQTQPQLFYWFAGFVMRDRNDSAHASKLFDDALKLDPKSYAVLREAARNELFIPNFEKAQSLLDRAMELESASKSHKETTICYDLQAQLYIRKAEALVNAGDYIGGLETLDNLRKSMSSLDRSYIDEPFANHISKTRPYCLRTLEQRAPFQLQSRVRDLSGWLNRFDAENGRQVLYEDHRNVFEPPTDTEHEYMGSLKKQGRQPTFGFLVTLDGKEVFLHQKSVPRETWFLLQTGAFAKFSVEYDDQARPQAINVQPTAWTPSSEASVHGP